MRPPATAFAGRFCRPAVRGRTEHPGACRQWPGVFARAAGQPVQRARWLPPAVAACGPGHAVPEAAAAWLVRQGPSCAPASACRALTPPADGQAWRVDGTAFDAVVLATSSTEAARLVSHSAQTAPYSMTVALCDWAASAQALRFRAISTVYAQGTPSAQGRLLPEPMMALHSSAEQPAQFVFDRGQLGGPPGLLAFVASDSQGERTQTAQQVFAASPHPVGSAGPASGADRGGKTRHLCLHPGLQRPGACIAPWPAGLRRLHRRPHPATLEGAVRSGWAAAQALAAPGHIAGKTPVLIAATAYPASGRAIFHSNHRLGVHKVRMVEPVVLRASRSRCACCTSASG